MNGVKAKYFPNALGLSAKSQTDGSSLGNLQKVGCREHWFLGYAFGGYMTPSPFLALCFCHVGCYSLTPQAARPEKIYFCMLMID